MYVHRSLLVICVVTCGDIASYTSFWSNRLQLTFSKNDRNRTSQCEIDRRRCLGAFDETRQRRRDKNNAVWFEIVDIRATESQNKDLSTVSVRQK